jgi:hypothetical protein
VGKVERLLALPQSCLVLAQGALHLHPRSAAPRQLVAKGVTAVGWDGGEILVAADHEVRRLTPTGQLRDTLPSDTGVSALARSQEWLVLGYEDGNMELVSLRTKRRAGFSFEEVATSPVERIVVGPRGTLFAGYASGFVGLWDIASGVRLDHTRVHGAVTHLLLAGRRLYAASDLGSHIVWDLEPLYLPYCAFLRQVWARVPVVWRQGLVVIQSPPRHRCRDLRPETGRDR